MAAKRKVIITARQVIEDLSLEVATPTEARDILELSGGDQVAF